MAVWALGINHTTAPLDMRGRFAFAIDQIGPTLQAMRHDFGSVTHQLADQALGIHGRLVAAERDDAELHER